ncbi:MAG: hypothetical protein JNK19_15810 [Tabrizicola sp.]|nr:hypothetical protein [Tabrizicola sp.]
MCKSLVVLLFLSSPALAQQMCAADARGAVPSCMVGTWTGENDMEERMNQMFAQLPENVWASGRPGSGQNLFIRIGADGHFITSPMAAAADAAILSDSGFIAEFTANLQASGGTGYFSTSGTEDLAFCSLSGGWGVMSIEGEGGGAAAPVVAGGSGFTPAMRYACSGDSLQMFVDLPPPMGTVTYDLRRIPVADIPPEFEAIFAD